jgi:uncharacterized protein YbjT (DUF2867 family)
MPRKAILVGATGLVGGHLLHLLLNDPAYEQVTALVRRPLLMNNDKLAQRVVDFERLEETSGDWEADDVFLCLGTTIAVAGSRESFHRVDHDYTVEVARLAKKRGAVRAGLVSSIGAAVGASSFYLRVKGETERDVEGLGFASLEIARPSLLVGERKEKRRGEAAGIAVTRAVSFAMVGALRAYRPIGADRVAAGLLRAVLAGDLGRHVRAYDDIIAFTS